MNKFLLDNNSEVNHEKSFKNDEVVFKRIGGRE